MANLIRYVRTSSTTGGNGTENTDSGDNRAFPTLAAAIAYLKVDGTGDIHNLSGGSNSLTIKCTVGSGTAADTTRVVIADGDFHTTADARSTFNATHTGYNITIESLDDHGGSYNTSAYRLEYGSTGGAPDVDSVIEIAKTFVVLTGIQIKQTGNHATTIGPGIRITSSDVYQAEAYMDRCIIVGAHNGTQSLGYHYGVWDSQYGFYGLTNCLIYGWANEGNATAGGLKCYYHATWAPSYAYNCTFVENYDNVQTVIAKNVLSVGGVNTDFASVQAASNYCISSDDTAVGANSTTDYVWTSTFVNAAAKNYHLASAIGGGTDLSGTAAATATDIDGDTRSGTWDVGADQYVSGAPAFVPRLILF